MCEDHKGLDRQETKRAETSPVAQAATAEALVEPNSLLGQITSLREQLATMFEEESTIAAADKAEWEAGKIRELATAIGMTEVEDQAKALKQEVAKTISQILGLGEEVKLPSFLRNSQQ